MPEHAASRKARAVLRAWKVQASLATSVASVQQVLWLARRRPAGEQSLLPDDHAPCDQCVLLTPLTRLAHPSVLSSPPPSLRRTRTSRRLSTAAPWCRWCRRPAASSSSRAARRRRRRRRRSPARAATAASCECCLSALSIRRAAAVLACRAACLLGALVRPALACPPAASWLAVSFLLSLL